MAHASRTQTYGSRREIRGHRVVEARSPFLEEALVLPPTQAQQNQVIDLHLAPRDASEWASLVNSIIPPVGDVNLSELVENSTHQDVTNQYQELSVSTETLMRVAIAVRLSGVFNVPCSRLLRISALAESVCPAAATARCQRRLRAPARRAYRLAPLKCQLMPLQRIVLRDRKSPKLGSAREILTLLKRVRVCPSRVSSSRATFVVETHGDSNAIQVIRAIGDSSSRSWRSHHHRESHRFNRDQS